VKVDVGLEGLVEEFAEALDDCPDDHLDEQLEVYGPGHFAAVVGSAIGWTALERLVVAEARNVDEI
jgi:hypothetical protein